MIRWALLTLLLLLIIAVVWTIRQPDGLVLSAGSREVVPTLQDSPRGLIYSDCDVDAEGTIHLAYSRMHGDPERGGEDCIYYQRASQERGSLHWDKPRAILSRTGQSGLVRIIVTQHALHLIRLSGRLQHFISIDQGETWTKQTDLVPADSEAAIGADIGAIEDTLVVTYTQVVWGRRQPDGTVPITERSISLHVVRWLPGDHLSNVVLRWSPGAAVISAGPRVDSDGKTVHLVCAFVGEPESWLPGGTNPEHIPGLIGQLVYWRSLDGGATWSESSLLPLPQSREIRPYGRVGTLSNEPVSLAIAGTRDRVVVVIGAGALVEFESSEGVTWSGPRTIDVGEVPIAGNPTTHVWLRKSNDHQFVAVWLTKGFQEHHFWRDFPFSTDREPENDDIAACRIDSVSGVVLGSPARLTPRMSYVPYLSCRVSGDDLVCVWPSIEGVSYRYQDDHPSPKLTSLVIPIKALPRLGSRQ